MVNVRHFERVISVLRRSLAQFIEKPRHLYHAIDWFLPRILFVADRRVLSVTLHPPWGD
jgi:hypothetical protein